MPVAKEREKLRNIVVDLSKCVREGRRERERKKKKKKFKFSGFNELFSYYLVP